MTSVVCHRVDKFSRFRVHLILPEVKPPHSVLLNTTPHEHKTLTDPSFPSSVTIFPAGPKGQEPSTIDIDLDLLELVGYNCVRKNRSSFCVECRSGGMADTLRSGRSERMLVGVQIPPSAPFLFHYTGSRKYTAGIAVQRTCHSIYRGCIGGLWMSCGGFTTWMTSPERSVLTRSNVIPCEAPTDSGPSA